MISNIGGLKHWDTPIVYPTSADDPNAALSGNYYLVNEKRDSTEANVIDKAGAVHIDASSNFTVGEYICKVLGFDTASVTSATYSAPTGYFFPTAKLELVAKQVKETVSFTVTYNAGTGAAGSAQTHTYDDLAAYATANGQATGTKPEASFSRTGYTFAGWATSASASTALITSAGSLAPLSPANGGAYTLYALWTPNPLTITYNGNATSGVTGVPATQNTTYGASPKLSTSSPSRTGWTFDGWATTANGAKAYSPGDTITNITANMTLYARWLQNFTISYNANKPSGASGNVTGVPSSQTVVSGNSATVGAAPSLSGYVFDGWATSATGAKVYDAGANIASVTSNIALYARWLKNPSISFNANIPAGAVTGYNTASGMPSGTTITYNSAYTLPNNTPTLMGYTFAGWKAGNTGTALAAGASAGKITADTVFWAQWTEKSGFSVVFYDKSSGASDGTAYDTKSNLNWTTNVPLPTTNPTKTGYTFGGWFFQKDSEGSGTGTQLSGAKGFNQIWLDASKAGVATTSTTQIKLYAKWTMKDRVQVTLNPNGGSYSGTTGVTTSGLILNGGSYTIPATGTVSNPTRTGYNFTGWWTSSNGTGTKYDAGATLSNLTSSITLYAGWTAAQVTFTYDKNAADATGTVRTETANYGSNLNVPAGSTVYSRTGYTLTNWGYTDSSNASKTVTSGNVPVANFKITWTGDSAAGTLRGTATLIANWTPYTYTIKWDGNGGTSPSNTTGVKPADTITLPTAPTRSGYTFNGWNTAANGSGKAVTAGATVSSIWSLAGLANNATLTAYAQWVENKVQIRFFQDANTTLAFGDNGAYTSGTILYVGAATGAIYDSASATTPSARNISAGIKPVFTNAGYEFVKANGAKWTIGSATGTAVATGNYADTTGLLTVPKVGGLYTTADYYITTSPKGISFSVQYFQQNANNDSYPSTPTKTTNSSAPFGNTVQVGSTAGTSGTTTTIVLESFTGFAYDPSAAGTIASIVIGTNTANNVIKVYFKRNTFSVSVSFTGDVPAGMSYNPATQTKKFGESVTLTAPTAPEGYTFKGWTVTSGGVTVSSNAFTMPNNAVIIQGVWEKNKVVVYFKTGDSNQGTIGSPASQTLDYGDSLSSLPTVTAKTGYYFLGWQIYEGCTSSNEGTGTNKGVHAPEDILSHYGSTGTPWAITSTTVMVARFGRVLAVNYVSGVTGAFTEKNGAMMGGAVTTAGTQYAQLQNGWTLPHYGGAFDTAGDRNGNNPHAAAGYKFIGWEWEDALAGDTKRAEGSYNASHVFVWVSGDKMPTTVDQSYTFRAIWEETVQQLHFDNNVAGLTGLTSLTGTGATDKTAHTGELVTLPDGSVYKMTTDPTAYKFLGWTTDATYVDGTSPLYTSSFTMTPGTRNPSLYTMAGVDNNYGVTLYPVFSENGATIKYQIIAGGTTFGTLSRGVETITMAATAAQGSTATANTGYRFLGWFTDAAGTTPVNSAWVSGTKLTPGKVGGVFTDATYYAKFAPEQYTITFNAGANGTFADGTTTKTVTLDYNTTLGSNVPGTKANTGYQFKNWSDGTKTYASITGEKVTGNKTYTVMWDEKTGYTVVYDSNGARVNPASQSANWTAVINDIMNSDAKNIADKKQGYSFDGWYTDAAFTTKLTNTMTFADIATAAGAGTDTITLHAKWIEKSYTVHFVPNYPEGSTTIADKTVKWTEANLLGSNATLTLPGYTFTKWSTTNASSGTTVTNTTTFSSIYQGLFGNTDNTKTEITLYGIWGTNGYNVRFVDETGKELRAPLTNLTWTDTIDYFNYTVSDGSAYLDGWYYTPAGGVQQTWKQGSPAKLPVSAFGGSTTPANGTTFDLVAKLVKNAKFVITFNKVDFESGKPGTLDPNGITNMGTVDGYMTPGTMADIKNLNTHNYIEEWQANHAAALKGYEYKIVTWPAGAGRPNTKETSIAADVVSGATVNFVVYWVEKQFAVKYDLGVDSQGNAAPSSLGTIADKTVGWNSTNLTPDAAATPSWTGHAPARWQYKNTAGNWVDLPAGTAYKTIAANDTDPFITLRAFWEIDTVRITYTTTAGGTAKSTDNTIMVGASGSGHEDINAVSGTPHTMVATPNANYKFVGWYKDGVLVTTDASLTPVKPGDIFQTATYEARFVQLGQITYEIEYWLEQLDGTYAENLTLAPRGSGTGQEGSRVVVTDAMKKNIKGFTYNRDITGSIYEIDPLTGGQKLKLYYQRNEYNVTVLPAAPGADKPSTATVPTFPSTGITSSNTMQKYGAALVIPTMTVPSGWDFYWTVTYTEKGQTNKVTLTLANAANFTMPDGAVTITGTWGRGLHNVSFKSDSTPGRGGTVTVKSPATMPFKVNHGKTMLDAGSTGNYGDIIATPDADWALMGWSYVGADGKTYTTQTPNSVVINCDTTFTAIWAQTFFVSYSPGSGSNNHGGAGFTSSIVAGDEIADRPNVNTLPLMIGGVNRTDNAPATPGYRFVGWTWTIGGTNNYWIAPSASDYDTSKLVGTAATMDFEVASNVIFTAIWEALEQNLVFSLGHPEAGEWTAAGIPGSAGVSGDYSVNPKPRTDQVVTLLGASDLTRIGFTFEGWAIWTDRNGDGLTQAGELSTERYTGTFTMPAHSVTFVAMWAFDGMKINYQIATKPGETFPRGTLSSFGENITGPDMAVAVGSTATANKGYKFVGWFLDPDCTIPLGTAEAAAWVTNTMDGTIIRSSLLKAQRPATGWLPATYYALFDVASTEYTITYMVQNLDGTYSKAESKQFADLNSEAMADVTDSSNPAAGHLLDTTTVSSAYYGMVFDPSVAGSVLKSIVKPNGTTELILFYNRVPFKITYDLGTNGSATGQWAGQAGPSEAFGGARVNVPAATLAGSSLAGWEVSWIDATDGSTKKLSLTGMTPNFTMPMADATVKAIWAKNVEFSILVYKLVYDENGNLVTTTEAIQTAWPNTFTTIEGQTVTIRPGANTLTINGTGTQTSTLPGTLSMPAAPGWAYVAGICDPFGVYTTGALTADGDRMVLKIYYAPKTGYTVNYVLVNGGSQTTVGKRTDVLWTTDDLAMKTTIGGMTGLELEGYGWQYRDAAGNLHDITAAMTYGNIVRLINGRELDTVMSITLYAKVKARNYTVVWVDDTNGADDVATEIFKRGDFVWTSDVPLSDPSALNGYTKNGYKWMGWEVRPEGATSTKYAPGATVDFKSLASLLGISDSDTGKRVTIYAVWVKWAPVTIEFYTDDNGVQTKLNDVVRYSEADQVVYVGANYTVPVSVATAHRPMGYNVPGTMPSVIAIDGENILKVIYTVMDGFKLNLDQNYGNPSTLAQIISGLTWSEKPAAKATAEPTRKGYRLKEMPLRWNTKADGSGHSFDVDATYAQIAEWVYGAGIDDATVLAKGITLYAQWTLANDFEVIYNLNNDPEFNKNILTVMPDNRTPIDVETLHETNVGWHTGGFDKSNDAELSAAPNGYEFAGWNTKVDGTGLQIDNTMTYEQISDYIDSRHEQATITLYAQWKELIIEITYEVSDEAAGTIDRFVDRVSAVTLQPEGETSSPGNLLHSVATANPGWHFVAWEKADGSLRMQTGNTYDNVLKMLRDDLSELSIDKHANDGRLYAAKYVARFERNDDASVKYDANGGYGTIDPFSTPYGLTFALDGGSGFGRDHHTLRGWNTKADGTGTHYALGQGDLIMPQEGMTLYAEWDINSYSVNILPPKDGGSVVTGSTDVVWGNGIPGDFISSRNPWADRGWSFSGWEYTMTNADTGEVTTGFINDLSELTVLGPVDIRPVFEGAYIVDGPPRTGDTGFDMTYALVFGCAAAMFLLLVIARRRREEEEEN